MPSYPGGFCGGSDTRWSTDADDQQSVNLYTEMVRGKPANFSTPGCRLFLRVPQGPVRALFYQDGRAFVIAGSTFYEFFQDGSYVTQELWRVGYDQQMATIHTNGNTNGAGGHQLFMVSGGVGYTFDLNDDTPAAFQIITDVDFPANQGKPAEMGAFIDGYFVVLADSTFWISDLEDGSSWVGTEVGQLSKSSNSIISMLTSHDDLIFFGSKTTEIWTDTGNASFPFQPRGGAIIEQGCIARWSPRNLDNSVIWLGGDSQGSGVVYRMDGYTPKRVSTNAVETKFQSYPRLDDTIAWTYQQQGHLFYVLMIPSADTSWVYDPTLPPELAWHERAVWNPRFMRWQPYRGQCHVFAFDKHLIGDTKSGAIYEIRTDLYDEEWAT